MEGQNSKLQSIMNNETITYERHHEFLYHLQLALLLALREQRRLSAMEYHYAEEKLNQQRIERARNMLAKGENP